jgi:hypothetical protein
MNKIGNVELIIYVLILDETISVKNYETERSMYGVIIKF